MTRASLSSAGATLVDGIVYQLVLTALVGRYGAAAFLGALLGGVTNFAINRLWTFPGTTKRLGTQMSEYAFASLSTYLALQSSLYLLVEFGHTDQRVAWIPAKIIAWLLVSYPLQRFLVFGSLGRRLLQAISYGAPAPVTTRVSAQPPAPREAD
jgi:putative flippase GtrA